jgi:hypothetical protein
MDTTSGMVSVPAGGAGVGVSVGVGVEDGAGVLLAGGVVAVAVPVVELQAKRAARLITIIIRPIVSSIFLRIVFSSSILCHRARRQKLYAQAAANVNEIE